MGTILKPAHGSVEWLRVRQRDAAGRVRFGASESPVLMGVSKWSNLVDLAIDKWTEATEPNEPNAAMERGNVLEPALVDYAATLLGCAVTTPAVMYTAGRLIATLDGITEAEHPDEPVTIVEAKTTTFHSNDDPLPAEYFWQGIAQLACVPEADRVLFVCLDKRMRLGHWVLLRDEEAIAELVAQADSVGRKLDARELPTDIAPTEAQVRSLFPQSDGTVELPVAAAAVLDLYRAARATREEAEAIEQTARDQLVAMLGGAEVGTFAGERVLSFKTRKGSMRVDMKALELAQPELVAEFRVQGAPVRVLKVL